MASPSASYPCTVRAMRGGPSSAAVSSARRQERRSKAERRDHAALEEFADRHPVTALERELQQHVAGVRVDVLLAGCASFRKLPVLEHPDELRQRVAPRRPGRLIGWKQQAGGVGRELADRDAAD